MSTNTFSSPRRLIDDAAREGFERLLDRLVIVAALRIDGDPAEFGVRRERERIGSRRIAHAERDRRLRLRPQRQRRHAVVRALLHPAHRPVMTGVEPALELEPGRVRGIRTREAARSKAKLGRLRPYCFFKVCCTLSRYTAPYS